MELQDPRVEKLNALAVAMFSLCGLHIFFSLVLLPGTMATGDGAAYAGLWRLFRLAGLVLGILMGGITAYFTTFVLHAKNYRNARIASMAIVALPFLGPAGAVTVFALPLGIAAYVILGRDEWKSVFADMQPQQAPVEEDPSQIEDTEGYPDDLR